MAFNAVKGQTGSLAKCFPPTTMFSAVLILTYNYETRSWGLSRGSNIGLLIVFVSIYQAAILVFFCLTHSHGSLVSLARKRWALLPDTTSASELRKDTHHCSGPRFERSLVSFFPWPRGCSQLLIRALAKGRSCPASEDHGKGASVHSRRIIATNNSEF